MSMDPRHPEQAIPRIGELYEQFKGVIDKVKDCTTSNRLGELEREGTMVTQELFLVVPRLQEALILESRKRRQELSRRPVTVSKMETPTQQEVAFLGRLTVEDLEPVEKPVEKYVAPNQAEAVIVEPKPRKKKTTKKKVSK